jgi:NAD+ synthase
LHLDTAAESARIATWMRQTVSTRLRKRGAVLGVSGGIDSAVCAALAVRALGRDRVLALLMPERDSSPQSLQRGLEVCAALGIAHETIDITPVLEALGCYALRDAAIRQLVPDYGPGWRCHLAIAGGLAGGINFFHLRVQDPQAREQQHRLGASAYLQIVAATNHKQRVRKTLEYSHADRLNRAVVGTPNRLEHELGFFVKQGDGQADLKPIAHLYKSQVIALARHLGLPDSVCSATPTTDTYPLQQDQDTFFFGLPLPQVDLALWTLNQGGDAAAVAARIGCSTAQASAVVRDLQAKRQTAQVLQGTGISLLD